MNIRSSLQAVAAAAAAVLIAAPAQAAPITDWNYTLTGVWSSRTPTSGVSLSGNQKTLSWGADGSFSSLVIGADQNGSVQTQITGDSPQAGTTAAGLTLTHNNNVLPSTAPTLAGATLTATLILDPTSPDYAPFPPASLSYNILFEETTNSTPCAATSPSGNPCNDIFVQTSGFLNQVLTFGDQTYYINIFPINGGLLNTLSNSACQAAGAPNGCIGFTTIENQSNTLSFGFTISTERFVNNVPEPGTLALLGAALLGAGAAGRRRKTRQ